MPNYFAQKECKILTTIGHGFGVQASVYNVYARAWIAPSESVDDIEQGKDRAAEHARTYWLFRRLKLGPLRIVKREACRVTPGILFWNVLRWIGDLEPNVRALVRKYVPRGFVHSTSYLPTNCVPPREVIVISAFFFMIWFWAVFRTLIMYQIAPSTVK
jgi:hypothetical protein